MSQKARLDGADRPHLLQHCMEMIQAEVARKRGMTGVAIRKGFNMLNRVRPTVVQDILNGLLDDFVDGLEPLRLEYLRSNQDVEFEQYLASRAPRVAETLLTITDARATRAHNRIIRCAYMRLRPIASQQIQDAVPAVARLVEETL